MQQQVMFEICRRVRLACGTLHHQLETDAPIGMVLSHPPKYGTLLTCLWLKSPHSNLNASGAALDGARPKTRIPLKPILRVVHRSGLVFLASVASRGRKRCLLLVRRLRYLPAYLPTPALGCVCTGHVHSSQAYLSAQVGGVRQMQQQPLQQQPLQQNFAPQVLLIGEFRI